MRKISLVMLVAVLSLCYVSVAGAAYFQDNFENNTTVSTVAWPDSSGDFDPDAAAVGTWNPLETGGSTDVLQVSNFAGNNAAVTGGVQPGAHSGSNYMLSGYHYDYTSSWATAGLPTANLSEEVTSLTLDCWVWGAATSTPGLDQMYISAYQGADRWGNGAFYIRANSDGVIGYMNSGWTATSLELTEGAWNHLVISADMSTYLMNITLNGTSTGDVAFYYQNDVSIGSLAFYADTTAMFDDILVTPEPATLVLLGLSGLGLLRKRRNA